MEESELKGTRVFRNTIYFGDETLLRRYQQAAQEIGLGDKIKDLGLSEYGNQKFQVLLTSKQKKELHKIVDRLKDEDSGS